MEVEEVWGVLGPNAHTWKRYCRETAYYIFQQREKGREKTIVYHIEVYHIEEALY